MSEYTIVKCEGCGELFRLYMFGHYGGDPNYCPRCNEKSGGGKWQVGNSSKPTSMPDTPKEITK